MGVLRDYDELDDLWQTAIGAKGIDNVKKGMQAINYFINENVHILPWHTKSILTIYSKLLESTVFS